MKKKKAEKAKPVKAWGWKRNGELVADAVNTKKSALRFCAEDVTVVRVEIREI